MVDDGSYTKDRNDRKIRKPNKNSPQRQASAYLSRKKKKPIYFIPSYDLSSDHSPIITTLGTTIYHSKPQARLHNSRTNWDTYKTEIRSLLNVQWKLKTQEDIDTATSHFTKSLRQAAKAATPIANLRGTSTTSNSYTINSQPSNYLPSHIKHLVALKRRHVPYGKKYTRRTAVTTTIRRATN